DVDAGDGLRRQRWVAVRGGEHEVPETCTVRHHGQPGELHERREDGRVDDGRVDLEVIVDPERLEAGRLALPGDVHGPLPGLARRQADVLPIAALRQADAQPHGVSSWSA